MIRSFSALLGTLSLTHALSASYHYSADYGVMPSVVEVWEPDVTVTEHFTTTVRKECADCQTGAADQVTSSVAEVWTLPTTPPSTTTLVPVTHWDHDGSNPQVLVPDHAVQMYYGPSGQADSSTAHPFQWINATLSDPAIHLDQSRLITYTWSSSTNTMSLQFSTKEAFDTAKSSWSTSNILIAHVEGCGDHDKGDSCYIQIDTLAFSTSSFSCEVTGEPLGLNDFLTSMKASWGKYTPSEQSVRPAFDPNFSVNAMSVFSSVWSKYATAASTAPSTYPTDFPGKSLTAKPSGWDYIPAGAAYDAKDHNDTESWYAWGYGSGRVTNAPYGGRTTSTTGTIITSTTTTTPTTITSMTTTSTPVPCSLSSVVSSLSSMFASMAIDNNGGSSQCSGPSNDTNMLPDTTPINGSSPTDGTTASNSTGSSGNVNNSTGTDISNGGHSLNDTQSGGSLNNGGDLTGSNSSTSANNTGIVDSGSNSGTLVGTNSTIGVDNSTSISPSNDTQVVPPSNNTNGTSGVPQSNCTRGVDPIFGLPTTCIGPAFDIDLDSIDGFLTLDQTDFAAIIDLFPGLITESVLSKTKRGMGLEKRCGTFDLVCKAKEAANAALQAAEQAAAAAAAEAQKVADAAAKALQEAADKAEQEAKAAAAATAAALEAARLEAERIAIEAAKAAEEAAKKAAEEAARRAEEALAEAQRVAEEAARVAKEAAEQALRLAEEAARAAEQAAKEMSDAIVAAAEAAGQGISDAAAAVIADIVKGLTTAVGFDQSVSIPINIAAADLKKVALDSPWGPQPPLLYLPKSTSNADENKDYAAADSDDENKAKAKVGVWLYCVDCEIIGTVELEGALEVSLEGIKTLMVGFNADIDVSLGLGIEANALLSYTFRQELFRQGIQGLCSGTTLCIGPYVSLAAELTFKTEAYGHLLVGGKWSFNDASAELWAYGDGTSNSQGWTPAYDKRFDAAGEITLGIGYGMPLSVGCGITILNGKWSKNAELSVVPSLEATAKIGGNIDSDDLENFELDAKTKSGCEGVDLSLDWNIRLRYNIFDLLSAVLWELGPQNIGKTCLAFDTTQSDPHNTLEPGNSTDTTTSTGGTNSTDSTSGIGNNSTESSSGPITIPGNNGTGSLIGPIITKVQIIDKSDLTPLLICNGNVYKQERDFAASDSGCTSEWLAYNNAPVGAYDAASVSGVGSIVTDADLQIAVINRNTLALTGVSRLRLVDSEAIPSKSEFIVFDWINHGWAGMDRFGDTYQAVECKNLNATTAGIQPGLSEVFMVQRPFPEHGLDTLAADKVVYSISNGYVRECQALDLQYALSVPKVAS